MNLKITTSLLMSIVAISTATAMEMTTGGDAMMKDKMVKTSDTMMRDKMMDDGKMMKKDNAAMMKDKMMMKMSLPTINVGHGSRGEAITALQSFLIEKGFLVLPAGASTGYFGPMTKKAVMMYQESVGVSMTGYFGPKTRIMAQEKMGMKDDAAMMKDKMMDDGKMMKKDGAVMMKDKMVQ